ncbi:MAG TPA: bifunctional phosphopantothenoylcysteine decarboxylase/phosphopantothenate--cysteine ligase CoaBC [Ferruginibacter sp.]|nr:bifunctional phosphopantothenoylcysteine decarboxylase/phosphopantothenate--cysteine ligase CoaBC [Ferruginibacter sp.]HMP21661.1 bifunctional phosphopantothenoylcysteine decarboxylase/phosphopantothenate--cysteine ligase CoaBC [Ferruginibacter sp.]
MLTGKKILIGVTGSIAAYKIPLLVRHLVKSGADVKIIMTPAAADFVTPLTLSTVSKNTVLSSLSLNDSWANHVMLGRWADMMLIAPLSCNTLAKMANGSCDNLLMAVYLSAVCPVMVAPAMDEDMWKHPATKKNLETISGYGNIVLPVDSGELASGLTGEGRMAEPEAIVQYLEDFFFKSNNLKGKKALVTAGPTYEAIDPVRFIGNHSSGKMGIAIATVLQSRGAEVILVLGPTKEPVPTGIQVIQVRSSEEMFNACADLFPDMDIAVMSAAVADYKPVSVADKKIKKQTQNLTLELEKTKDILKHLGTLKKDHQKLIGFALETDNEKQHALSKLQSKNADMIVLNSMNDAGAGFGYDTNKISIFTSKGQEYNFETKSKKEVAVDIVEAIIHDL